MTTTSAVLEQPETVSASKKATHSGGMLRNASWNSLGTLFGIVISFVSAPLLIHAIGAAHYGILLLLWSLTGVFGVMSSGVGEATLRHVAFYHGQQNPDGIQRVFGATLAFYGAVAMVALAAGVLASQPIMNWLSIPAEDRDLMPWLISLATVSFSLSVVTSAFAVVPPALQRYDIGNKIGMTFNLARTGGYIALATTGFGLLYLVLWDIALGAIGFGIYVWIARRMLPHVHLRPALSRAGLREVLGYSLFSTMTTGFLVMYREGGKLLVSSVLGPTSVAYFGTADSVAYRLYMVVVSGVETLVPRFSADPDPQRGRVVVNAATWACLALTASALVPIAVTMPILLNVWIGSEFARQGGTVGQYLALGFFGPAAFAVLATYIRGRGHPAFVTAVLGAVATVFIGVSALLLPTVGLIGVGIANLATLVPWLAATWVGWVYMFRSESWRDLLTSTVVPLCVAAAAFVAGDAARVWFGAGWFDLVCLGTLVGVVTVAALLATDLLLGGRGIGVLVRLLRSRLKFGKVLKLSW